MNGINAEDNPFICYTKHLWKEPKNKNMFLLTENWQSPECTQAHITHNRY